MCWGTLPRHLSRCVLKWRNSSCGVRIRYQGRVACRVQLWGESPVRVGKWIADLGITQKLWISVVSHFEWRNVLYLFITLQNKNPVPPLLLHTHHKHTSNRLYERLRWSRGSVLAFGTLVRGFTPCRSRRIFRGIKPSAHLPSEGK